MSVNSTKIRVILTCIAVVIFSCSSLLSKNWQAYSDSAGFYFNKNDFTTSLKFSFLALESAKNEFRKNDTNSRITLRFIGETYYYLENLDSAEFYFQKCIESFKLKNVLLHPLLVTATYNLALVLDDKGKADEAIEKYKEALDLGKKVHKTDNEEIASILNAIGIFYKNSSNLSEAEKFYLESLEMYRRLYNGDNRELASTICNTGNFYFYLGKYDQADKLHLESIAMRRRLFKSDHKDLANGLGNYSILLLRQSRFAEAEIYCKEATDMYQRLFRTDNKDLATMYNNMGNINYNMGKFSNAEEFYKKSIEMRRRIFKGEDNHNIASDLNNLAVLYKDKGRYSDAEPLFFKSLEMYKRLHKVDHYDIANSLGNIALLTLNQGRYSEAEKYSNESLEMIRRLFKDDNPALSKGINNHALILEELNQFVNAEKLYKESIEIDKKIYNGDNQEIIKKLVNLGNLYLKQSRYSEAEGLLIDAYEMSLRLFDSDHPIKSNCLRQIGKLYLEKDDYKKAKEYFLKCMEMENKIYSDNHPSLVETFFSLAIVNELMLDFDEAENFYFKSLKMNKEIYLRNSINLSEYEKEFYWNTLKNRFEYFYSFVVKRYKSNPKVITEMFNNILFAKGLLLNSNIKIKNRILNSSDFDLIEKFKEWRSQKEYLAVLYKMTNNELLEKKINRDSVEKFVNKLEKELSQSSELFASEFEKKQIEYVDIQNNISKNEAVVEIIRFHKSKKNTLTKSISYAALILTSKSEIPSFVLLENGDILEKDLYNIYKEYNNNNKENTLYEEEVNFESKYSNLYSAFWEPIQIFIKGFSKVILSPDGVFNQINLLTLKNPFSKRFLIDELNIHIITTSRDLVNLSLTDNNLDNASINAVLFGFPNYDYSFNSSLKIENPQFSSKQRSIGSLIRSTGYNYTFPPLPGTKTEVENIQNLLQKAGINSKIYLENSAMEDTIKSISNPTILHIATHGFFLSETENEELITTHGTNILGTDFKKSQENPLLRSGLLFTGASNTLSENDSMHQHNTEDGILTAFEAQNLNLDKTELVILSACETGKGELKSGEGVYGLQRAFRVAGTKKLIMSLWKVDDEATQIMMTNFYTNWINTKDLQKSFKNAQNQVKKKYKDPYYWGAFIMVGI